MPSKKALREVLGRDAQVPFPGLDKPFDELVVTRDVQLRPRSGPSHPCAQESLAVQEEHFTHLLDGLGRESAVGAAEKAEELEETPAECASAPAEV